MREERKSEREKRGRVIKEKGRLTQRERDKLAKTEGER